jgi:hypothetical protein
MYFNDESGKGDISKGEGCRLTITGLETDPQAEDYGQGVTEEEREGPPTPWEMQV